ncbi:helix-turn-helix domain-containing protein [Microlunatus soli]|uniref:AraC family transcriptional regulator, arabinose operon regulatory protein n=1 Tax=Microlunatus soli TaxID=630515 RepID=A0A1H1Z7R3_9ACTN|nr:helix-turn-helix domain-containing protein [Microlunatus soli]SDT29754.1 AraC family transcriptional regulator, arabinose operon regulatory protein [Microlunatus soli]
MAKQTDAVSVARRTARVLTGRLDGDDTYRTVRLRGTTDWLLLATVAGGGRLRVTGQRDIRTGPDQITVVEPYVPHDYGTDPAAGRWTLRWAHLEPRPDWLPLLDWPSVAPGIRQLPIEHAVRDRVVANLDRATVAARSGLPQSPQFAMNAVEEVLLWCDTQNPRRPVLDPRLLAVLEYAGDHLDRPHTVASLARIGGLSATRLAHLAGDQLGTSLMAHIQRQRMDLARQLLIMTDLPIAEVAGRVGYDDPLYFSRRFRIATSTSPSAFRSASR